ncbi:methyltransferase [Proteinivorax hydrogeniformans]|uniref:Methyltransferase n=1 Tax=Proteinivorax hydrogeniformans TaxID=1826727 RepID=A0AAU8HWQ2_9FIRM
MTEHYFTQSPESESNEQEFVDTFNGKELRFVYDASVFSKGKIDKGSALLVQTFIELNSNLSDKIQMLDLGCGYGFVTVAITSFLDVSMTSSDINQRAVSLCEKNCRLNSVQSNCIQSDGFNNFDKLFDFILLNPPIRTGKKKVYSILKESYNHLNDNGELWVVIRVKQGAKSMKTYLQSFFSSVDTVAKKGGYHILRCEK